MGCLKHLAMQAGVVPFILNFYYIILILLVIFVDRRIFWSVGTLIASWECRGGGGLLLFSLFFLGTFFFFFSVDVFLSVHYYCLCLISVLVVVLFFFPQSRAVVCSASAVHVLMRRHSATDPANPNPNLTSSIPTNQPTNPPPLKKKCRGSRKPFPSAHVPAAAT